LQADYVKALGFSSVITDLGKKKKERRKEYQNNDCEDDPGSREKNGGKD